MEPKVATDDLNERITVVEEKMKDLRQNVTSISIPRAIMGGVELQQGTIRGNINTLIALREGSKNVQIRKAIDAKLVTLVAAIGVPNIEEQWVKK